MRWRQIGQREGTIVQQGPVEKLYPAAPPLEDPRALGGNVTYLTDEA